MRESNERRAIVLANLMRCVNNQILLDGVHIERTPGYYRECAMRFAMPLILARLNQWDVPVEIYHRVGKMLEFSLQSVAPDGTATKSGDNSASRDGWYREQLLARLTGQKLPVSDLKSAGLLSLVQNLPVIDHRIKKTKSFSTAHHFKYSGFAVARSSWKTSASYIFMKLDGYGGAHSHADFLSFNFAWEGRSVIDERGMWFYDNSGRSITCRLAESHNVLLLGGRDMFEPKLDEMNIWAKRPPIVKITEVVCRIRKGKGMEARGKVTWKDRAWWKRRVNFVYDYGLTIVDGFWQPVADKAILQFYFRSNKLILEDNSIVTADKDEPNVRISFETNLHTGFLEISRTEVYDNWFTSAPAWLVRFSLTHAGTGTITTTITGV